MPDFSGAIPIGSSPEPDKDPSLESSAPAVDFPRFGEELRNRFLKHLKPNYMGVTVLGFDVVFGTLMTPQGLVTGWVLIVTARGLLLNNTITQCHACGTELPMSDHEVLKVINGLMEGIRQAKAMQANGRL